MQTKKVYVTFPKNRITEPVICQMYQACGVEFNIRTATVNDETGIMALELTAKDGANIDQAIAFMQKKGLIVKPIEMDVVAG